MIDAPKAVAELYRLQAEALKTTGRPKIFLSYTIVDALFDETGQIESFRVTYPDVHWEGQCDRKALRIGAASAYPWADLDHQIEPSMDDLHRWLYQDREKLVRAKLSTTGSWSEVVAPGWFMVQMYHAIRAAQIPEERS